MELDLNKIKKRADDAKGWGNIDVAWIDNSEDVAVVTIGRVDDDGGTQPVAFFDCQQHFKGGDEMKLARFYAAVSPAIVLELVRRLREAEKAADRMREALQLIADMQSRAYYKVNPKETAKDAHLIAVGALANSTDVGGGKC